MPPPKPDLTPILCPICNKSVQNTTEKVEIKFTDGNKSHSHNQCYVKMLGIIYRLSVKGDLGQDAKIKFKALAQAKADKNKGNTYRGKSVDRIN